MLRDIETEVTEAECESLHSQIRYITVHYHARDQTRILNFAQDQLRGTNTSTEQVGTPCHFSNLMLTGLVNEPKIAHTGSGHDAPVGGAKKDRGWRKKLKKMVVRQW